MTNNGTEAENKNIKNAMGYKNYSDLGILAKAAWEVFEGETTKAAVKTFYAIDTPAKIQLERWEQYNEYEQDFNEFEPEDDSGEITRNFGHRITSISHKQVLRYRLFQDL